MWLEMSRDTDHGGGSWGFTQCLWAPTRKRAPDGTDSGGTWPFWEHLLRVRTGDQVLHLRGEDDTAAFVGFSTAATDGYQTSERPPITGPWSYATSFYRVPLREYTAFPTPIRLRHVFREADAALRTYFAANKDRPREQKRSLFYVVQANRLQCLNGAYLSEVDEALAGILLGDAALDDQLSTTLQPSLPLAAVDTGVRIRELRVRDGQQRFSIAVRENYGHRCAFPSCSVDERPLLVGAHIARWADAAGLRGVVANGICWCLIHDRAFEVGLFTITADGRIAVNTKHPLLGQSTWCQTHLVPFDGQPIQSAPIPPSREALRYHWTRIGFMPPA